MYTGRRLRRVTDRDTERRDAVGQVSSALCIPLHPALLNACTLRGSASIPRSNLSLTFSMSADLQGVTSSRVALLAGDNPLTQKIADTSLKSVSALR